MSDSDRYIEDGQEPVCLEVVVDTLKGHQVELQSQGISELWVFGSVARGEEGRDSDFDLVAKIDPDLSLTAVARLRLDLMDLLGRNVDLAEWRTLHAHVAEAARNDAVQVF